MSAPDIILLTPNGRFELGKKVGHGMRWLRVNGQRDKGSARCACAVIADAGR